MGTADIEYHFNNQKQTIPTVVIDCKMSKPIFGQDFQDAFDIGLVVGVSELSILPEKQQLVSHPHQLSNTQKKKLDEIIAQFPFCKEGELNFTTKVKHHIDTGNNKPIQQKPYPIKDYDFEDTKAEIERALKKGIIKRINTSEYNLPIIPVRKPNGKIRIVLDARKLNKITKRTKYCGSDIQYIFSKLPPDCKYFSAIDASDAYHQIKLTKESQEKCAFSVRQLGKFCYLRMPAGLTNASVTLNLLVDEVFQGDDNPHIHCYMDDFLVCSVTFEEHCKKLIALANKLHQTGLAVSKEKSLFCMSKLKWLGQIFDGDGMRVCPDKCIEIVEYKAPRSLTEVRKFLGLTGWFKRYIVNYAGIAAGMTDILKTSIHKHFVWTKSAQESFEQLKIALTSAPVLQMPNYEHPFYVEAYCGERAIGGMLTQKIDNKSHIIACMSAKLKDVQQRYHPVERQALAVIAAVEKFKFYTQNHEVIVLTRNNLVQWLAENADATERMVKWGMRLSAYDLRYEKLNTTKADTPASILSTMINESTKINEVKTLQICALEVGKNVDAEVCLIDINDFKATECDWYIGNYNAAFGEPENNRYKVENSVLYYRYEHKVRKFEREWKICVPKDFQVEVLHEEHDGKYHRGFYKTYETLYARYYWPKMYTQTYKYIRACQICKEIKPSNENTKTEMGAQRTPMQSFEIMSIDHVGPLTETKQKNKYLCVVMCLFTKFLWIKPMPTATSSNTKRFLKENIFSKYAVPRILIADNGKAFISNDFKEFCKSYNVKLSYTPVYRPQANPTECVNKQIGIALRAYCKRKGHQVAWDEEISDIACCLNSNVHTTTKVSPYMAVYGKQMVQNGLDYKYFEHEVPDYDKFEVVKHHIREQLKIAHETTKNAHNLRARPRSFEPGDIAYIINRKLSDQKRKYMAKLGDKKVTVLIKRKVGTNTYELETQAGKCVGIFSVEDIYRY